MIKSLNNHLGNYYPFYLNNYNLTDQHYLYQLYSPGMSEDMNPYLSMTKVSEKTHYGIYGKETDILKLCIERPKEGETKITPLEYLKDMFKNFDIEVKAGAAKKFPVIEIKETPEHESLEIARNLIVNLRDSLRWKFYRFYKDRYVDILWTPTDFALYQIKIDNENLSLEPRGLYENRDVMMQDPLDVDYYKLQTYKWPKDSIKATDLERFIRKLEWTAFDRRPFSD